MERKEKIARRYDHWSPFYDTIDTFPLIGRAEKRWRLYAIDSLKLKGNERVLDVGTGSGLILPWIGERLTTGQIIGVDISDKMLKRAEQRVRRAGMSDLILLKKMDAEHLAFDDGFFHAIISTFTFTSVPDPEGTLNEVVRVLAPGGRLVTLDTGRPQNIALKMLFPMLRFTARTFGYTYIDRPIPELLYSCEGIDVVEEKRFFGGMVYCITCIKQT